MMTSFVVLENTLKMLHHKILAAAYKSTRKLYMLVPMLLEENL
jgi:hypothetical protein